MKPERGREARKLSGITFTAVESTPFARQVDKQYEAGSALRNVIAIRLACSVLLFQFFDNAIRIESFKVVRVTVSKKNFARLVHNVNRGDGE